MRFHLLAMAALFSVTYFPNPLLAQDWKSGIQWNSPPVVTPGKNNTQPPSDAIVLFDGTDLSAWKGGDQWIIENGVAITDKGDIRTKQAFGDVQLHIEWSAPTVIEGDGQGRGNSGVFFMEKYEVQVLDSYQNDTYVEGQAGSIYKQIPPMVNAMRKPGEWNTYDIIFTAPKFGLDTTVSKPATITVIHNGIVVVNHHVILGETFYHRPPSYIAHAEKLPIKLQFHQDRVQFRNIWVRELSPITGERVSAPYINRPQKKKPTPKPKPTTDPDVKKQQVVKKDNKDPGPAKKVEAKKDQTDIKKSPSVKSDVNESKSNENNVTPESQN